MNILCIGGGPAGLYFALLMKQQNPAHRVTVVERNRPFDTFGWGVVLSDQTLANLQAADAPTAALIGDAFNHWDDIEVFFKGRSVRSTAHGFCGIGRKRLLNILQDRCLALGVDLQFETDVADDQALAAQYHADLVIASDGLNGRIRTRYAATCQPDIDLRQRRFVWLGTQKKFDAFTFAFEQTEHAGSRPTPTSSTPTPPPSSSKPPRPCGRPTAWTRWSSPRRSPSAKNSLPNTWTATPSSATPPTCAALPTGFVFRV